MAKRYQPPRDFARNNKKPKLDISINKGRPLQINTKAPQRTSCSPNDDFWDDGEDDVLLLATQVAETAASQKRSEAVFTITESELTFSEFAPNAATSTQRPSFPTMLPNNDILSQMFNDDDDFDLLAATKAEKQVITSAAVRHEESEKAHGNKLDVKDDAVFKKPLIPTYARSTLPENTSANNNADLKVSTQLVPSINSEGEPEVLSQSAARRQLASERQIKFLMDRLDALKKENIKLTNELEDSKSKILTKEGEASLLRDELKHIKQQMHSIKMEKILSTEAAKSESKTKLAELAKQVEAKKTELQLKAAECMQLKMQHAEVTQRFEMSMRNDSLFFGDLPPAIVPETQNNTTKRVNRELLRLRSLTQKQINENRLCALLADAPEPRETNMLYKDLNERTESGKGIITTVLQKQWQTLRTTVAELQLAGKQHTLNELETKNCAKKVFTAATWTLHVLSTLAESLPVKNCRVYQYHDYELQSDYSELQRISLLQPQPLYDDEQAILMRRIVATMAVLCRQYSFLALEFFSCVREVCNVEGEYLLVAAAKKICRIGYSTELVHHFGLLEAFALLLQSLLLYALTSEGIETLTPEQHGQIVLLLKELIFVRPNIWLLRELSFCVVLCSRHPNILNSLCQHCPSGAFRGEPVRSTCEFTKDSCVLQVYVSLLEIAFPLNEPIREVHLELLTVICFNHVRFVYQCFTRPPKFIHEQLPCYDDDEGDEAANEPNDIFCAASESNADFPRENNSTTATNGSNASSSSNTLQLTAESCAPSGSISCECYNRLCLSVVTLVYQVLRQWLHLKQNKFTAKVGQISKICVQLLHVIFCDNYLTSLFRDAEDTTKHYLYLICKWWQEHHPALRFNDIHLNFLKKLQNSHIMPKHLQDETNIANLSADLSDWCRITNDVIDSKARTPATENLNLLESAVDADVFFEGLKGYAFNFQ